MKTFRTKFKNEADYHQYWNEQLRIAEIRENEERARKAKEEEKARMESSPFRILRDRGIGQKK